MDRCHHLDQDRDRFYRAGDMTGREKAGKEMAGMAKSLERDPQVESILRGRERELGLEMGMGRGRALSHQLTHELGIGRDRGLSRSLDDRKHGRSVTPLGAQSVPTTEERCERKQSCG